MAEVVRNLNFVNFGFVREDHPTTHYTVNASTWYKLIRLASDDTDRRFYMQFAAMPASLKRKAILRATVTIQIKVDGNSSNGLVFYPCTASVDFSALTWNKQPGTTAEGAFVSDLYDAGTGARNITINPETGPIDISGYWFKSRTFQIMPRLNTVYAETSGYPSVRSVLVNGTTAPRVSIVYDDSIDVTSKVYAYEKTGPISADSKQTFEWDLNPISGYYCADMTFTQASAVFRWRVSGTSSWNTVNISGSTTAATIPANTFPTGKTIEWQVSATDTDGTTTTSTTKSFSTRATLVQPAAYPSGSSVDERVAQTFTWQIRDNSGQSGYTQASAVFRWRKSGATSWNTVNISGNTKSTTIPAYTFPSATAIEWQVTATDYSGASSTSETYGFTTLATTLAITSAPAGSNIDTRSAIPFSWSMKNTAGDVNQRSAILYWRVSGASAYTAISYTGSTKSISVPANTFPTGKTIQWYVTVTDATGTALTSNAATFTTVSTKITLDSYPSGNNVYTAQKIRFTWHFASNVGNYTQASTKLYWRTGTAQAWNTRTVTGNTQYMDVPANTFPTNATVQWYLEGTDSGGLTTQTSTMSFKTVTTQITAQNSPTSGYADPRNAIKFQWYFSSVGGAVPQGSATFYWRVSGTSAWTSVAASGSTASVTIPANTFPVASTIEWYVTGTDVGGTASTSPTYSFSTAAETAYAYPQSPIGVTVDTGKAVTLRWILANADGTQPARVSVSWKTPTDVTWTVLRDAASAFTSYTAPAGTFPVGEIEWRVIATNRDGIAGPAGTAAFISLRAPDAPVGLTATAVPRTTIRWQGGDQEAYEILIDGETVRQAYGADVKEWTPDFVLEDGIHVIAVRIQGPFGLWSDPAVTTIDVQNAVPAGWEDLAIAGAFGVDAELTMTGAESPAWTAAHWYRDGKRIAVTHGVREYDDRYVLGVHRYWVELWADDGNYARSNVLTGTLKSCITRIALFESGDWLDLKLSESSASEQQFRYSRTTSARHVLGTAYPVLEMSDFEDYSGTYDCAFKDTESAARFESLRGQVVILKSRGGRVLIGVLSPVESRYTDFYIAFTFSIQAIDWEDFREVS